ncbi:MAG: ribbon-helix-helix protein, CopG family [Actinoallomurus sp.]
MSVKERITVTVDSEIAAQIKELAGQASTSSLVERALREMLTRQLNAQARLEAMLAAHEHEDPEIYARTRTHVRRQLGLPEEQK